MTILRPLNLLRAAAPALALFLALPFTAQSAALTINGACVTTDCTSANTISSGQSVSGTITYTYTFGDGDKFGVSAPYSASYTTGGSQIFVDPIVTYLGTTPSVANETLNIAFLQYIFDSTPGVFDGPYTETIPLSIPAGGTGSGQLFVDGDGVGLVGPYGPGAYSKSITTTLTGLTGNTLALDYAFTFTFAAGAAPGATASSPSSIPEPSQTIPAALALSGLAALALIRRNLYNGVQHGQRKA